MSDPVITAQDVRAWSPTIDKYTDDASINIRIPIAQEYVNTELNDLYDKDEHGKENVYRAAVCRYTFYLLIPELKLMTSEGVGNLQQNTIDLMFMDQDEKSILRSQVLSEVTGYISDIKQAMEDEGEDLESPETERMGSIMVSYVGGNSNYKTDYGDGLQSNDDELRGNE